MKKVKIRAYGGTGSLIARAFVDLLIVNPISCEKVDIDLLDLDQSSQQGQNGGSQNDFQDVLKAIETYKRLHDLGLKYIAAPEVSDARMPLQDIRKRALGIADDQASTFDYSVKNVFDDTAQTLMLSCMTLKQYVAQNADGCHADLSRNAMIAYAMQTSSAGFAREHAQNLEADDTVIYMGSTDGGTANTFIDPDLKALIKKNAVNNGDRVKYRVYSVRTLPYKRIPVPDEKADPEIRADAEARNEDLVAKSVGVLRNIAKQTNYVATYQTGSDNSIELVNTDYLLDALIFLGTNTTDASKLQDTNCTTGEFKTADQHHKSHTTEYVAALSIIDALFDKLQKPKKAGYYIYKDECDDYVSYSTDYVCMETGNGRRSEQISMSSRIKGFLSLYTLVKFHLIGAVEIIAEKDGKNKIDPSKVSESIRAIFGAIYNFKRRRNGLRRFGEWTGIVEETPYDILTDNPDAGGVFKQAELKAIKATLTTFIENATPFVAMISETDPCYDGITNMETNYKNILSNSSNPFCDPSAVVSSTPREGERVLRGYQEKNEEVLLKMRGDCAKETDCDVRSDIKTDAEKIGKAIATKLLDGLYLELISRDTARAINQN